MAENKASKGGGSKLNRTQTVTLRLDPRLRYLTELASRIQRRTTSSFIEWAIEESLKNIVLKENYGDHPTTLDDEKYSIWDVDEPDRFVKLAIKYPNLLNHSEQILWKLIAENLFFWNTVIASDPSKPSLTEDSIDYKLLRQYWDMLNAVAEGNADMDDLPKLPSTHTPSKDDDGFDDIPF